MSFYPGKVMSQKPTEKDKEDQSKRPAVPPAINQQYPPINMFIPPPGYPYYPSVPWYFKTLPNKD